jgi:hypothetical protein
MKIIELIVNIISLLSSLFNIAATIITLIFAIKEARRKTTAQARVIVLVITEF